MKISLDDDLYADYVRKATIVRRGVMDVITDVLDRFRAISPTDRVLLVTAEDRSRLEGLLSGGSLVSADDLVNRVEALASLRIGDIRLDFTAGQMAELARRAERNGRTLEAEFVLTVKEMEARFFDYAARTA